MLAQNKLSFKTFQKIKYENDSVEISENTKKK